MSNERMIKPYPGMKIYEDVSFLPGIYNFFQQEGIHICASNITIHGNGSVLIGGKEETASNDISRKDEFSYGYGDMIDQSLAYYGHGIHMEHVHHVRINDLQVRGFVNGLYMEDCENCQIENNDFSYNYNNNDWGWDEHIDAGGIMMIHSHHNVLKCNKATNVWSALVLRYADHNEIRENDFSHTSNVGLRCWGACHNLVEDNDFSWGIRKAANEVHARDSSCVLIESGSNHNIFCRNDMRYGGDGLFIRSLNNEMSMYNLFEENDASFANNNAIEAWDAHNTYIRNKANYSSYGFWLGCSDHSVLIGNEVIGNGVNFQNAPESFGNAGIAVVNGSGNDFYLKENIIMDNNGPGIAIRNTKKIPSQNWIIENNKILHNHNDERGYQGYGIYMKHALNIHLINNVIDNDAQDIFQDDHVCMVTCHPIDTKVSNISMIKHDAYVTVDEKAEYEAEGFDQYAYYFDDGYMAKQSAFTRSFSEPGRYRMFLNAKKDHEIALFQDTIYVKAKGEVLTAWQSIEAWSSNGKNSSIRNVERNGISGLSLCADTRKKNTFTCHMPVWNLQEYERLSFYYCYHNDFIDWKDDVRFCIILQDENGGTLTMTSKTCIFHDHVKKANEAKYEWEYMQIPLHINDTFILNYSNEFSGKINSIHLLFETPIDSCLRFDIADAVLETKKEQSYVNVLQGRLHEMETVSNFVQFSTLSKDAYEIFLENDYQYDLSKRWTSKIESTEEIITFTLGAALPVDGIDIAFYADQSTTLLPEIIQFLCDDKLIATSHPQANHVRLCVSHCCGIQYKLKMTKKADKAISIYHCQLLVKDQKHTIQIQDEEKETTMLSKAVVKLNLETWPKEEVPNGLRYQMYRISDKDINTATLLLDKELPYDRIDPGRETTLPLDELCVEKGTLYALLLFQEKLAKGIQEGAYYRWVGNGIAMMDGTYGYWNQDQIISSNKTGWGSCYLKLYHESDIYDHSTENEGLGNRFGLKDMEKLYQMFELPKTINRLQICDYLRKTGYLIKGSKDLNIKIQEPKLIMLYFKSKKPIRVSLDNQSVTSSNGHVLISCTKPGWQKLKIECVKNELMLIKEVEEDYDSF